MPRKYEHVLELLPIVKELRKKGKTYNEIAQVLGMANGEVARELLRRDKRKQEKGVPAYRGRKPAKTLQEYKYENKRLKMEVELLRDFLSLTERK